MLKALPVTPQASLPVQEYLFMPFDQAHKQYETARHLPPPLYVLFVQASAYGQACGEHRGGSAPPRARFHSCLQESPLLGGLSPLSAVL